MLRSNTGFFALGVYLKMECETGHDMDGNGDFSRYPHAYMMFRETVSVLQWHSRERNAHIFGMDQFCPQDKQLASYSAQLMVSKERICKLRTPAVE